MKCGATDASRRARRSRGAGCAGRASCPAASGRGDWKRKARVDWKEKLAPEVFERFARLRERRKAIAAEDGVPPYMVMTDAQMAEAASAEELTLSVPYDDLRFVPQADRPWYLQGNAGNRSVEEEDARTNSDQQKGVTRKCSSLDEIPQEDRRFLPAENRKEIAVEEQRTAVDGPVRHRGWDERTLMFLLVVLAGTVVGVVLQWDEIVKLYEEVRLSYWR